MYFVRFFHLLFF